ncbi:MAG: 3-deoxy-D-manno-octulosonate 8-phosphate phosphatase, partial [Pseudomonadota bacterium]|nr:3-deoxy-D-manno-octulosonate 8-phosphate phosphatase [Pseudomonadota bacterium]
MSLLTKEEVQRRARDIRCLFLDIDGVLTDGKLYIGPNGEETKTNFVRDGYGIKLALKQGLQLAVISGRPSEAMRTRLSWLGIQHIALDTEDKEPAYLRMCAEMG